MRAAPGPRFPPRRRLSAPTGSRACPHAHAGFLVAGETAANKPSPRTSALTHLRRWAEGEGRAARRPVGPRAWEKAEAAARRGAGGRLGRVDRQPAGRDARGSCAGRGRHRQSASGTPHFSFKK